MTGVTTSPILTDTTMVHIASELPGIGAVTTTRGIGMLGLIIVLGDSTDGISTTVGITILGTTVVFMILGTMEAHGDSTPLGTTADGMAIRTMQAGTAV